MARTISTRGMKFRLDYWMRQLRIRNLSELSFKTNVPTKVLWKMSKSDIERMSQMHIDRLCNFFGCEFDDLKGSQPKYSSYYRDYTITEQRGIVYFLKALSGEKQGLTKIGFTIDLISRIKTLEVEHKTKLELVHYVVSNDVDSVEKVLHTIFRLKRVTGEWFDLTDDDIELVKGD